MTERKRCIKCERPIDTWARICPFCNWDQSQPVPAREVIPAPVAEYRPPEEIGPKQLAMYAGAGVLLLIMAFAVGMTINRDGAPKNAPKPLTEAQAEAVSAPKRADTTLVPMNEPGGLEQPITSAPASGPVPGSAPNEWDRSDATAVSSAEYAQLAKRAKAEKKRVAALVDPRSITGAAFAQGPAASPRSNPAVAGAQAMVVRTRPIPQYQPVPALRARGSARLDLLVGADGRVKDISIRRAANGNNAALIGAVQSWRFKPATENGHPVPAPYSVEISFRQ